MKFIGYTESGSLIVEVSEDEYRGFVLATTMSRDFVKSGHFDVSAMAKAYRQQNKITQADFAERVGISRNYLSQIERGEAKNFSVAVYMAIIAECSK